MTNITFSVDDELHKRMRDHPEVKWTEILRQSIIDYLKKVEEIDVISVSDFRKRLDPKILDKVKDLKENDEIEFYEETEILEQERVDRLKELENRGEE